MDFTPRIATLILALSVFSGCGGGDGAGRLPVGGRVVGPSQEAISGSLSFAPAPGRTGPGATASIVNGKYQFDQSDGPHAGTHEVIIRRRMEKPLASERQSPATAAKSEWTRTVEIPAKPPYQVDFQLD